MEFDLARFQDNYARLRDEVESQAKTLGLPRPRIVVVSKYIDETQTQQLLDAGIEPLGENRAQQIVVKNAEAVQPERWHFIGHLQRNKISTVLPRVGLIHSVDSERLARAINDAVARSTPDAAPRRVLVQLNTSGEESKGGLDMESAIREIPQWREELPHLEIAGLMTMAPRADEAVTRTTFRRLRETRDRLRDALQQPDALPELSMGMSGDYRIAVEEGATLLRLGSILYQ